MKTYRNTKSVIKKQQKKNLKNAVTFLLWITFFVASAIYREVTIEKPRTIISPLPQKAYAKEVTPTPNTWDANAKLIIDTFRDLGKEQTMTALRVFYCESKLENVQNNKEPNGTNSWGIAQINSIHNLPDEIRLDVVKSLQWAKAKVIRDGWYAWSCY
jgi:hypothetical protein